MMAGTGIAGVDSAARMFRLVAVVTLIGILLAGCASAPGTSRASGVDRYAREFLLDVRGNAFRAN